MCVNIKYLAKIARSEVLCSWVTQWKKTYQSTSGVDADHACVRAVHPFWFGEAEQSIVGHDDDGKCKCTRAGMVVTLIHT